MFFRIIAGILIATSFAAESLTGVPHFSTGIETFGDMIKTYITYIEDKTAASEPAKLAAQETNPASNMHQFGLAQGYPLYENRPDSAFLLISGRLDSLPNKGVLLSASDPSPPTA